MYAKIYFRFADEMGLPLVVIHEFKKVNYFEALSEEILHSRSSGNNRCKPTESAEASVTSKKSNLPPSYEKKLVCDFTMPSDDFANFRDLLHRGKVCLENVVISGHHIAGCIRVLNLVFEKTVFVRYTTNNWRTVDEVRCKYFNNADTLDVGMPPTDSFSFEICGRSPIEMSDEIQFCIRFEAEGAHHWDNNDGANYVIITSEFFDQRKRVREMEKN